MAVRRRIALPPAAAAEALREGDREVTRIWDALVSGAVDAALVGRTAETPTARPEPRCLLPGSFKPDPRGAPADARVGRGPAWRQRGLRARDSEPRQAAPRSRGRGRRGSPGSPARRRCGLPARPLFRRRPGYFPARRSRWGWTRSCASRSPVTTAARRVLPPRSPSSANAGSSCSGDEPRPDSRPWTRWPCPRRCGPFATACRKPTSGPTSRPPSFAGAGTIAGGRGKGRGREGGLPTGRRSRTGILEAPSFLPLSRILCEASRGAPPRDRGLPARGGSKAHQGPRARGQDARDPGGPPPASSVRGKGSLESGAGARGGRAGFAPPFASPRSGSPSREGPPASRAATRMDGQTDGWTDGRTDGR